MSVTAENVDTFIKSTIRESLTGKTTEHSFRPFFKELFENIGSIAAVNEPSRSEHGAPDFVFLNKKNTEIIRGYAEMKDLDVNLDEIEKTDQIDRYKGYKSIILTNGLDWRFFRNGIKYFEITVAVLDNKEKKISGIYKNRYSQLADEINAFFEQAPEQLTNGARLAEIMGGKARRIRDNVKSIINDEQLKADRDIDAIYGMMRTLLVSDLTRDKFADMYAQTLVYGLFVARYNDDTPENFSRVEARDLVPKTNPFLREFFDHITGSNFNKTLGYIVDELCEIFAVSDIKGIVHKHLKITDNSTDDTKDPIIHFYEDFLAAYDPELRKSMGAYYTPIPVVKYIIRMVDKVLKEDFNIADGISSNEKIKYTHQVDQYFEGNSRNARHERTDMIPRVQILDPAVGTATFLNETIKYIYENKFQNNAGMWPSYVNENILPRLNGFEIMMTPYTIAHLKLGMTLSELGAKDLNSRLRVFLTNTLTEGEDNELPLFSFGLQKVVTEESNYASEVKNNLPVMVVIGNPPYSVSSSNKSKFIQELIMDYKKDLGERKINLDDDYIKFIRFSEHMIERNGNGIVAMITNNSYIDGITHRKMRQHLLETFDKIYILDLHGNAKKKEVSPDGSLDQNVFDIMQGVSIIVAIKKTNGGAPILGKVYHSELFGTRKEKFQALNSDAPIYKHTECHAPDYYFVPKDFSLRREYEEGIKANELFWEGNSGIETQKDAFTISFEKSGIENNIHDLMTLPTEEIRNKYSLGKDGDNWKIITAKEDVINDYDESKYVQIAYRPFDVRWTYYTGRANGFFARPRFRALSYLLNENLGLIITRTNRQVSTGYCFVTEHIADRHILDSSSDSTSIFPLYRYGPDGTRSINYNPETLEKLTGKIGPQAPEDVFDYIYAILHSPSYRQRYKEFLKIDFPRIPIPDENLFKRLVPLGRRLRNLHLMRNSSECEVAFPKAGSNKIEKTHYSNKKIWINEEQYFDGVPESAWNFYIGGYQPAQKWLKDRKGKNLSYADIEHYIRMINNLGETDRIMREIG